MKPSSPRGVAVQAALIMIVAGIFWYLGANAGDNLAKRSITFGFGFLGQTAGFDIPFHILSWSPTDTYARALWVCFINTMLVAVLGVLLATVLGLLLGIMRLSANWLVRTVSGCIVELIRNTPQLLQIVFWYVAVLQALPQARQSVELPGDVFLNIRGLFVPMPLAGPWTGWATGAVLAAVVLAPVFWRLPLGRRRIGPAALILPMAALVWLADSFAGFDPPKLQGFNFRGGLVLPPELVALWLGLAIYAAAFIAEIVRASIQGIGKGQKEAAATLGLKPMQSLFLVILPQALRIMIPQVTSQYLNIIKSSSLGAAIAYPEIVQIFAGTVLNQSGRALEVMFLVMVIFLAINLVVSGLMNWYNRKVALVER